MGTDATGWVWKKHNILSNFSWKTGFISWKNKLWETLVIYTAFIEILVFRNRSGLSKAIVAKVKLSDFRAEQTAHWSTHRLVIAVACLRTVKNVANPHISLEDTQNRIMRKFGHFNIRKQNVIFIMSNCTVLGTQIKQVCL